jgi:hypothetical protein
MTREKFLDQKLEDLQKQIEKTNTRLELIFNHLVSLDQKSHLTAADFYDLLFALKSISNDIVDESESKEIDLGLILECCEEISFLCDGGLKLLEKDLKPGPSFENKNKD